MCSSPPSIQLQLSEAVNIISRTDFPEAWPTLVPSLVQKFQCGNMAVIVGVLKTASSIFNVRVMRVCVCLSPPAVVCTADLSSPRPMLSLLLVFSLSLSFLSLSLSVFSCRHSASWGSRRTRRRRRCAWRWISS